MAKESEAKEHKDSGQKDYGPPDIDLSRNEERQVERRSAVGSRVVHEIVRRAGDEELSRPFWSLWWSGMAAGSGMCSSILGESLLTSVLPDAAWRPAVAAIGYTLGFLIVILGGLQLFTESTLQAVIPVATRPSFGNLVRLGRLWTIVLVANVSGTLFVAFLVTSNLVGFPGGLPPMIEVARPLLSHGFIDTMKGGVPAGFLLAAVAWALPSGRGQEFWITFLFTYFVGLGHFSHVIAGSGEAWLLVLSGHATFGWAVFGFILPAFIGNVLGGTMLFALLAHAQVRSEIQHD